MSQTQVLTNGDTSSSKVLDNLTSLPLVFNSIETFKANPYGAKSLSLGQSTYEKYLARFVEYARGPYTYISPYVAKADSLASDGLVRMEDSFPIVKQQPDVIKSTLLDYTFYPLRLAQEGRSHIQKTYGQEVSKCGGDPSAPPTAAPIPALKATVTTSLVLTSDVLSYLSSLFSRTRDSSRDFASAKYHQAQSLANQATRFAQDKKSEAWTYAAEKREDAWAYAQTQGEKVKDTAYATGKDVQQHAATQAGRAEKKTREAKDKAQAQMQQ